MSLQSGDKLAHYEILEPIGKGGMGEVYRAKDSKLGRDVAIKVLPDEFAQDEERLRRFQREAKVLASLNHPNIASIYGLEQSHQTHYLVLELVPGETLAERIARGPIPIDEALEIATKIAEALEEAHEQGIVHRDLKPANVKLTEDGKVKVLDFGLAKALVEETPEADNSMSPTLTRDATRVGVILGTAAYMSPEQAKGKRVDKRTDIFSFGCCLFEALTGRKAFAGDNPTEVMAAIIHEEPDWKCLPKIPWQVSRLLGRCLRKDLRNRLHDIGDARAEIQEAIETPVYDAPTIASSKSRQIAIRNAVALGLVGALASGLAVWSLTNTSAPAPTTRFAIALPVGAQLQSFSNSLALSPDGRQLVYAAGPPGGTLLYARSLDQIESRSLPGTLDARDPFFSPDGEWVGFFTDNDVQKVRLAGGDPQTICETELGLGGSWGRDDTIVFSGGVVKSLFRVPAAGGAPEALTTPGENSAHVGPTILPSGERVLFTAVTANRPRAAMLDLATGVWEELDLGSEYVVSPSYLPSGHLVFGEPNRLMVAAMDRRRLKPIGTPEPALEGIRSALILSSWAARPLYAVSSSGNLAYVPQVGGKTLVQIDRRGNAAPLGESKREYYAPRVSPNGERLAVGILDPTIPRRDIWVQDLIRGTMTRVTFSDSDSTDPVWSPDGERLAFASNRARGVWDIFVKPADGTGEATLLSKSPIHKMPQAWSPDGSTILFLQSTRQGADFWNIASLAIDEDGASEVVLGSTAEEIQPALSPDGRWLAFTSNETGQREVYVRPFPGLDGRWQISANGGDEPRWSPDGREIFYRQGDRMMSASFSSQPRVAVSTPRILFEGVYEVDPFNHDGHNYDVMPDGEHFIMIRNEEESKTPEIHVVLNWIEELKRLVPNDN